MGKKNRKKSNKLRDLMKAKKLENPYRQISRDPRPSDLKFDNWQKAAVINLKQDPENPRRACWKAITLSDHSGSRNRKDDNYDTMHWSLLGAISNALLGNMIDPDLTDSNTAEFRDHIMSQYDHDNAEGQFQGAWDNALKMTQDELYAQLITKDGEDTNLHKKAKFDYELLARYERLSIEKFTEISPVSEDDMENIQPLEFVKQVFPPEALEISNGNSKKSKKGFVAVGEKSDLLPLIFDPLDDKIEHPYTHQHVTSLENYKYMSRSIFKEDSNQGGRRTKLNLAKEHLVVAEADFTLYNGLTDVENMERFNAVMMIACLHFPLVYVIYSGGKSYHFGFAKNDLGNKDYDEIKRQFIYHGADATVIRDNTKYVRLPNVQAEKGSGREYQKLLYFDPDQINPLIAKKWDLPGFQDVVDRNKQLEAWHNDGSFYVLNEDKRWIKTGSVEDHLASKGFSTDTIIGENQSPVKQAKIEIEKRRSVDEVLYNLGGYDAGCYELSGQKVLVRNNRRFPKMLNKSGEWTTIKKFLHELLDDYEYQIFLGWLADSVRCNYNDGAKIAIMTPSQMMHIIGESNCGKTALTKLVLQPLFGGRMVNGSGLFLEKEDKFNTMEMGAELLVIDDKSSMKSTDANRENQSETLKSILVSGTDEIHGKGSNKIPVKSYTRIIRMMNHNKIPTLPKVNQPEVGDKVIILKGYARGEAKSQEWYGKMEKMVAREIPYFFRYLIKEHETPDEYQIPLDQGRRFPVISHHNTEIIAELNESSTSTQLEEVMNENLMSNIERDGTSYYEGTAMEIYNELRSILRGDDMDRFKKMFSSPDKFIKSLKELRVINLNYDTQQRLFYSDLDDIKPALNKDNSKYWRIQIGTPKKSKAKKFFGEKKEKIKFGK